MNIHEIENLPFAELKARGIELIDAAKTASIDELASRYVQARTDAKQRDELLAEQAETLEALKTGLSSTKSQMASVVEESIGAVESVQAKADQFKKVSDATIVELETQFKQVTENKEAEQSVHVKCESDLGANIEELLKQVARITVQRDQLSAQATKYNGVITSISKLAIDAINSQLVADAEEV